MAPPGQRVATSLVVANLREFKLEKGRETMRREFLCVCREREREKTSDMIQTWKTGWDPVT